MVKSIRDYVADRMALGLPKSIKLTNPAAGKALIATCAGACLVMTAIVLLSRNESINNTTGIEIAETDDTMMSLSDATTASKGNDLNTSETLMNQDKVEVDETVIRNNSVLKPYPLEIQAASRDLANLRNPFAPPTSLGSAKGIPAPRISIKGFAGSEYDPRVFLNINDSEDSEYQIGHDVGSGYRIVGINSTNQTIIISDGISRFNYTLKEF